MMLALQLGGCAGIIVGDRSVVECGAIPFFLLVIGYGAFACGFSGAARIGDEWASAGKKSNETS